jgi:hypothetical protein
MHKNATKCNETLSKWCKNKHEASKIIDTLGTYQRAGAGGFLCLSREGSSMAGGDEEERRPSVSVQQGVAPLSPSLVN